MMDGAGTTAPLWVRPADMPRFPELDLDLRTDACIVGAGVAGLTTALLLAREGRAVVVVDAGPVAGGEAARTTGHLAPALVRFEEIERLHGEHAARVAYASHATAIDAIERIVADEAIDCSFRRVDGYRILGTGGLPELLEVESGAARRAGCAGAERLPRLEVAGHDLGPCIRFPRQGQLHPLRYAAGLARAAVASGAQVFEHARAVGVQPNRRAVLVRIDGGRTIAARSVVLATHSSFVDRFSAHTKPVGHRSYAIALSSPRGAIPEALYWDTEDPDHHVRLSDGGRAEDLLIVGGGDHETRASLDPRARFAELEAWARGRFRSLGSVRHQWCGQVMDGVDGLGPIGRSVGDENVLVATGGSRTSMTHGTIAGMLIRDLVIGRSNEWAPVYDPSRTMRQAGDGSPTG